jgi:hypothetical protein
VTSTCWPLLRGAGSSRLRPDPRPQPPLPPFDPNDAYGEVHTVLPPEQVIPPPFTDPAWLRADFNGVTLEGAYAPTDSAAIIANGGVTITTGRWAGLRIPFLIGANTTPPTMIMTPMLNLYPRAVQDAVLTEHAERGLDDLVIDPESWNGPSNGWTMGVGGESPSAVLAWCRYVQSWGFRVVLWRGDPTLGLDPMLQTLLEAGVVSFYVHGEEVDGKMPSEAYERSLQGIDQHIGGRLPIGVHFTADGGRHMGYPIGFPRDTFLNDWSLYNGRVHLCQQLDVDASAGLQGSSMYYARLHVNCGIGDAAKGPGAPNSRVIAFETMATNQLYGRCDEAYGCLRTWELLCGTRSDGRARPVSGFGNGGRCPNGVCI